MSRPIVWLTGPPGSGKTTAGRLAAAALHLSFHSAGEIFRAEAKRLGQSLPEFSRYAERHPEVDKALDEGLIARARPGAILEGRVVGALLRRRGVPVYAIQITAREDVRARRVAGRDGTDPAAALAEMRTRSASERGRYRKYYNIDLAVEPVDAVIDSSDLPPAEVAGRLAELLKAGGVPG
ncbi:MAG TPA: AAA family ATPase [Thermoplasmata archaeon]|nr:AAA family ATPase [Thermoplasmata archaeon]